MAKWLLALALLALSGCTVLLGGPKPIDYDTVALRFDNTVTPAQAAAQLRELGAEAALITTPRDSAWVRELATQVGLVSTRPGRVNNQTLAFLASKPEGDTTLVLKAASGGNIHMHDALYKLDKYRWLDLMTIIVEPGVPAREATRALLSYIATDVKADAVTAMAIHTPNAAVGDTIAELSRAVWADAAECDDAPRATGSTMRLYYFPPARVTCESVRTINGGVAARLIVGR